MDSRPIAFREPSSDEIFQYMIDNPTYSYYNARETLQNLAREREELRRSLLEEQTRTTK